MFRSHLYDLGDVAHGGLNQLARSGVRVEALLDFSATVLPGGPPEAVKAAISRVALEHYPDPHAWRLRKALAAFHGLTPDEILPGNGSVELIRAIALTVLEPGDRALIVGPTFGEYAQAVRLVGAVPVEVRTETLSEVLTAIETFHPKLLFVCNPNNPTGHRWSEEQLSAMEAACFLVLDEAYAGFLATPPAPRITERRLTLRSMTKDFALAGLRLGYGIASAQCLKLLSHGMTPWGVSAVAQVAGIAALEAREEIAERVRELYLRRSVLLNRLMEQGWEVDAREAPYFLLKVGSASHMYRSLLDEGIVVRDATSFGLPEWIRLSPKGTVENERLAQALENQRTPDHPHISSGGAFCPPIR